MCAHMLVDIHVYMYNYVNACACAYTRLCVRALTCDRCDGCLTTLPATRSVEGRYVGLLLLTRETARRLFII